LLVAAPLVAQVDVLTQHNDNLRTGANLKETLLRPSNVRSQFGKLAFRPVDGNVYAQPLVVSNTKIVNRASPTSVVIVATEHNSVYAFDADDTRASSTTAQLWKTGPEILGTPVESAKLYAALEVPECVDLTTEIGITGTPAIKITREEAPRQGVVFVAAKSTHGDQYVYKLFALNLADGTRLSETAIEGLASGRGIGSRGSGKGKTIRFAPMLQLNRPGLLLTGNILYIAFGSHCDQGEYHGWLFAYDVSNPRSPKKIGVLCTTPNGIGAEYEGRGGIWMSGQGPAADDAGHVYFATADGTNNARSDFGDSLVKVTVGAGKIRVEDWYTPRNEKQMKENDVDFGSSGATLLPHSHLLIAASKEGRLYLIDRNQMGKGLQPELQSLQVTRDPNPPDFYNIHGSPVIWPRGQEMHLYVNGEEDPVKQYRLISQSRSESGEWKFDPAETPFKVSQITAPHPNSTKGEITDTSRDSVWMPGGTLSLSADGDAPSSGILWVSMPYDSNANHRVVRGVLRALDASDVSAGELWNSENTGDEWDRLGEYAKYCPPTIANGNVYVATFQEETIGSDGIHRKAPNGLSAGLAIYGLRQPHATEPRHLAK
jgi:hypothetical protein